MAVRLYHDHNVPRSITDGLRLRGVDVLTAKEDGTTRLSDDRLLTRASALSRALFTQDDDLLGEAAKRQQSSETFYGVIYAHQLRVSIGVCVEDLTLVATAGQPEDVMNQIIFLPL